MKFLLIINIFIISSLSAQQTLKVTKEEGLIDAFNQQLSVFPQEKIYLHTDKPYYITGEKIWFRAHLTDALTHIPAPFSRYVYVELFNSTDSLISRVKIRNEEGFYYGQIVIPPGVSEGAYTLRAYTSYMLNLDEHDLCTKQIFISHPKSEQVVASPAPETDFDVTFYPEGGSLLTGGLRRVAFKALMPDGNPAQIEGNVYDQNDHEYDRIKTVYMGMGSFMLSPEEGKTYHVVCTNDRGQTKRFELPAAQQTGYALTAGISKDNVYVKVLKPAPEAQNDKLFLLAHTRGFVHFVLSWDWNRDILYLPQRDFHSGVLHLVLFDDAFNPVSERLLFINNDDQAHVSYSNDFEQFDARAPVNNRIALTDTDGQPLTGNFSVAVTADHAVTVDSTANILTYLLLTSDLRGHIENPAAYFKKDNTSAGALDLLMLTQGWRRYDVAAIAQGRPTRPTIPIEFGPVISGRVKRLILDRSVEKSQVSIVAANGDYFDVTETDSEGRFSFNVSEQPDSSVFIVHAFHESKIRVTPLELLINDETFPKKTIPTVVLPEIDKESVTNYAGRAFQYFRIEEDMWTLALSEVTVTAQRNLDTNIARRSAYYGTPSNSINVDKLAFKPVRVADLLIRIPNVVIRGETISIRQQGTPLLVIDDNVQMLSPDESMIDYLENNVPVEMIEQIDVLKDASNTAVFGKDGANGVIMIFTKRGFVLKDDRIKYNIKRYVPLGYQKPVDFYAPKYDTPEKRNDRKPDLRTTIHWQPVVQTDSTGVASFTFYTADEKTSYSVVIEGVTDDGKIIRKDEKIRFHE